MQLINVIDFGLVVLIWVVQLIIYPGFKFYSSNELARWHPLYTNRISIIVAPLMLMQLFFRLAALVQDFNGFQLVLFVLILVVWAITFLVAVPLHSRIDKRIESVNSIISLIKWNWYRTLIWTIIFIMGLFE